MAKRTILYSILIAMVAMVAAAGESLAVQPLNVSLAIDLDDPTNPVSRDSRVAGQPVFFLGETISMVLTLKNESGAPIITSRGFSSDTFPFHLYLTFIGPDGKPITFADTSQGSHHNPPPPLLYWGSQDEPIQVERVESIPGGWVIAVTIPKAQAYYPLTKAGKYTVKVQTPFSLYQNVEFTDAQGQQLSEINSSAGHTLESNTETFYIIDDHDGDGYYWPVSFDSRPADCDDNNAAVYPGAIEIQGNGLDDDCNTATLDASPVAKGTIAVKTEKHTIGTGTKPNSYKEPIENMLVRVFDKSAGSCVSRLGVSWQNYKSIWFSCSEVAGGAGTTNVNGTVNLIVPAGDYVVIGFYDPMLTVAGDEVFAGVSAGPLSANQTLQKYLQIMAKADGKNVPAKMTVRTGSELRIIEPEYIEWSGTEELYPFIFESVGDWGVETSIAPPEGFVADYQSLSTLVNSDLKAIQFVVTDVGSDWIDTKMKHEIKHKGKTETIKSSIGIKCSEKLARAKGFDGFCKEKKK